MGTVLALIALVGGTLSVNDSTFIERARFGDFSDAVRIVAVGPNDMLVADAGTNEIVRIDAMGKSSLRFGGFGWAQGSFDRPNGIASDGVNIFVSDWGNHRIQRFDRNGVVISSLSTRDTSFESARFGHPEGVGITRFGDLLLLDGENQRILKFTPAGSFDASFAPFLSSKDFRELIDIDVAPTGRISVLDKGRLIVMDEFGSVMKTVVHPWFEEGRGLGGDERRTVVVCDSGIVVLEDFDRPLRAVPLSSIFWADPPGVLRDVLVRAGSMVVLTSRHIVILEN